MLSNGAHNSIDGVIFLYLGIEIAVLVLELIMRAIIAHY